MEVIFCSAQKYFTGKAFDANVANVINIDISCLFLFYCE